MSSWTWVKNTTYISLPQKPVIFNRYSGKVCMPRRWRKIDLKSWPLSLSLKNNMAKVGHSVYTWRDIKFTRSHYKCIVRDRALRVKCHHFPAESQQSAYAIIYFLSIVCQRRIYRGENHKPLMTINSHYN